MKPSISILRVRNLNNHPIPSDIFKNDETTSAFFKQCFGNEAELERRTTSFPAGATITIGCEGECAFSVKTRGYRGFPLLSYDNGAYYLLFSSGMTGDVQLCGGDVRSLGTLLREADSDDVVTMDESPTKLVRVQLGTQSQGYVKISENEALFFSVNDNLSEPLKRILNSVVFSIPENTKNPPPPLSDSAESSGN